MAVDPGRIAQFNEQGGSGVYAPGALAFYRMIGGADAPGIAKSKGPAGPGFSARQLQGAFNAYHPKQNKNADALLKIHQKQQADLFKTNMDLFKPRPGEPTPKPPTLPSPTTPFQPAGLPGQFGQTPKTPGAAAPSTPAPSQADVQRFTDATRMNQTKAFNEAAAANQRPDMPTGSQVSDPNAPTPGQAVLGAVARDEGLTPQETQNVMRAMARESSGGYNEWQAGSTHDVNSASDPAFGPLQVIGKTFDAHADPGWNRFNPYYSMRAAIRYARDRYGPGWSARMAASGY